jgi:hypothetical protein
MASRSGSDSVVATPTAVWLFASGLKFTARRLLTTSANGQETAFRNGWVIAREFAGVGSGAKALVRFSATFTAPKHLSREATLERVV